jgi:hypothetical protein
MGGDNNKSVASAAPREAAVLAEGYAVICKVRGPTGPCRALGLKLCLPGGKYTAEVKTAAALCAGGNPEFRPDTEADADKIKAEQAKAHK